MYKVSLSIALFIASFSFVLIAQAHPGRTDASGCHTCRTNCSSWGLGTGEYHCHQAKALPQPEEPIKSTYGANGTGTTEPAPEYEIPKLEVNQRPIAKINSEQDSSDKSDNTWAWVLGLGGAGAGGYWLAKKK
jgi:hypothetical protein